MSDAPERIWASFQNETDTGGTWHDEPSSFTKHEYIRADLYQQQDYRAKYARQAEHIAELERLVEIYKSYASEYRVLLSFFQ